MNTDQERIIAAGRALHGSRFQRDLAADLAVNERTVRRWMAGTLPVPDNVWGEVARHMKDRITLLTELVEAFT